MDPFPKKALVGQCQELLQVYCSDLLRSYLSPLHSHDLGDNKHPFLFQLLFSTWLDGPSSEYLLAILEFSRCLTDSLCWYHKDLVTAIALFSLACTGDHGDTMSLRVVVDVIHGFWFCFRIALSVFMWRPNNNAAAVIFPESPLNKQIF